MLIFLIALLVTMFFVNTDKVSRAGWSLIFMELIAAIVWLYAHSEGYL